MINTIVNVIRYLFGVRYYDNWSKKHMYYVLTKSGNFSDWLHIRRQIKYRDEKEKYEII